MLRTQRLPTLNVEIYPTSGVRKRAQYISTNTQTTANVNIWYGQHKRLSCAGFKLASGSATVSAVTATPTRALNMLNIRCVIYNNIYKK